MICPKEFDSQDNLSFSLCGVLWNSLPLRSNFRAVLLHVMHWSVLWWHLHPHRELFVPASIDTVYRGRLLKFRPLKCCLSCGSSTLWEPWEGMGWIVWGKGGRPYGWPSTCVKIVYLYINNLWNSFFFVSTYVFSLFKAAHFIFLQPKNKREITNKLLGTLNIAVNRHYTLQGCCMSQ